MFVFAEIPLHELLEILQSHLPRLGLLQLHLVEACVSKSATNVFLKPIVEKRAAA